MEVERTRTMESVKRQLLYALSVPTTVALVLAFLLVSVTNFHPAIVILVVLLVLPTIGVFSFIDELENQVKREFSALSHGAWKTSDHSARSETEK